jgi:hypothetical protein
MLKLNDAKFVISPPGNGIDCHRTWEALIMGAIPIVMNTSILPVYDDQSVMIINNWQTDVNIDALNKYETQLINMMQSNKLKYPKRSKVYAKYWMQLINQYRDPLIFYANKSVIL